MPIVPRCAPPDPIWSGASRAAAGLVPPPSPSCANFGNGAKRKPSPPTARRYFILRHESLIDIAVAATTGKPVETLIPPRFSERRYQALIQAIKQGLAVPPQDQPQPVRNVIRRISDATKRRMEALQKLRDVRATELGIDPTLIASRAMLLDLAEDWNAHEKELMNWQRELLKP